LTQTQVRDVLPCGLKKPARCAVCYMHCTVCTGADLACVYSLCSVESMLCIPYLARGSRKARSGSYCATHTQVACAISRLLTCFCCRCLCRFVRACAGAELARVEIPARFTHDAVSPHTRLRMWSPCKRQLPTPDYWHLCCWAEATCNFLRTAPGK
jgi:hypothetical protein